MAPGGNPSEKVTTMVSGTVAPDTKKRRVKATAAWVGALVTAVVTAVAVTLAVHFSEHAAGIGQPPARLGAPVTVEHITAAPYAGDTFAFPTSLRVPSSELAAFDSNARGYMPGWVGPNQNYPWAWAHGGAAVYSVVVKLDLRGNRNDTVRIEGMQLAEQCQKPAIGTLFYSPPAGQGPVIRMGFNLDKVHPIAQLMTGRGLTFGASYFSQETIILAPGESQQVQLIATTQKYYCSFRINMAVLDGNSIVHELISNGRQPFRVTAPVTAPERAIPGTRTIKYASYQRLYVGGVASDVVGCSSKWVEVNPLTYSDASATPVSAC